MKPSGVAAATSCKKPRRSSQPGRARESTKNTSPSKASALPQPMEELAEKLEQLRLLDDPLARTALGSKHESTRRAGIALASVAVLKDVFVGGQHVVKDHRHIHEDQIARNFRAALRRLDT